MGMTGAKIGISPGNTDITYIEMAMITVPDCLVPSMITTVHKRSLTVATLYSLTLVSLQPELRCLRRLPDLILMRQTAPCWRFEIMIALRQPVQTDLLGQ
jgi:hypothetical protein